MNGKRILTGFGAYVRRHHLGLLALFVALSGTAYAVQKAPKNSVVTKSIKNAAVTKAKLAPNSVDGSKVVDGSLTGADVNLATLGAVPNATHATKADEATKSTEAAKAIEAGNAKNAEELGGSAASNFVKGTDSIPGGDLTGTYANPTVHLKDFATSGFKAIFAPSLCPGGTSGPSLAVNVPSSGLVEVLAKAQMQVGSGGNAMTACLTIDGGSATSVLVTSSTSPVTLYTQQGSSIGTTNSSQISWTPFFVTPGPHTFALGFGYLGATSSGNQVDNRFLIVRAIS
jgi:hypothetical protein